MLLRGVAKQDAERACEKIPGLKVRTEPTGWAEFLKEDGGELTEEEKLTVYECLYGPDHPFVVVLRKLTCEGCRAEGGSP